MNSRYLLIVATLFGLAISGCSGGGDDGGNGGAGGSAVNALFKQDMAALGQTGVNPVAHSVPTMMGTFTKVFPNGSSADVVEYINLRAKHVYSVDEIINFRIEVEQSGSISSGTLKELGDPTGGDDSALLNVQGINFGTALADVQFANKIRLRIFVPTGAIEANSTRIGLIGLTPSYSTLEADTGKEIIKIPIPLEARVGVLVHEGRHSDCPEGFDTVTCGYGHAKCPTGHPLAGELACDNSVWGPYAIEAVYMAATMDNYPEDSQNRFIMEILTDDVVSRITQDDLNEMKITMPNLESM